LNLLSDESGAPRRAYEGRRTTIVKHVRVGTPAKGSGKLICGDGGSGAPRIDRSRESAESAMPPMKRKPWRKVRAESVIIASLRLGILPSALLEISVPGIIEKLAGLEV